VEARSGGTSAFLSNAVHIRNNPHPAPALIPPASGMRPLRRRPVLRLHRVAPYWCLGGQLPRSFGPYQSTLPKVQSHIASLRLEIESNSQILRSSLLSTMHKCHLSSFFFDRAALELRFPRIPSEGGTKFLQM
jgi:hypothetical protein